MNEDQLAEVLDEHWGCVRGCDIKMTGVVDHQAKYAVTFSCGGTHELLDGILEGVGDELSIYVTHRAHVASVIVPLIAADAWDECLKAVNWAINRADLDEMAIQYVKDHNPYRSDTE